MRGATIAELIIVVTVLGTLVGIIFGPFNDLYTDNSRGLRTIIQTSDTRGALRLIEREVVLGTEFLDVNAIDDISGNIPGKPTSRKWDWRGNPTPSTTNRVLIVESYASRMVGDVRTIITASPACTTPLMTTYVYFVDNGNLYRRILKNSGSYTGCGGAAEQKRLCLPTFSSASCEGKDALIVSGVKSFTVNYYLNSMAAEPITDQWTNGSVLANAKTVVLTLTTTTGTGTNARDSTSVMRITRLNA